MSHQKCIELLETLKVGQLQHWARLIGLSTSGRKSELQARLAASLLAPRLSWHGDNSDRRPHRLLSIDMGIRNLAYCAMEIPQIGVEGRQSEALADSPPPVIKVVQWQRLALSTAAGPTPNATGTEADVVRNDELAARQTPPSKEKFAPQDLAAYAVSVLDSLVLRSAAGSPSPPPPPDSILIERQRWRSGGGSAVQEWTLRVNSLEAMLWSGLSLLRQLGRWSGSVHAVDPGAVGRFWVPNGLPAGKAGKNAKIAVARRCMGLPLDHHQPSAAEGEEGSFHGSAFALEFEGQALRTMEAFVAQKMPRKATRRSKNAASAKVPGEEDGQAKTAESDDEPLAKKDDLADCLLQGMAWVEWERNRKLLAAQL